MDKKEPIEAYPLTWPQGYNRNARQISSRFKTHTLKRVWDSIRDEIKRLGATNLIISSNIQLKNNGTPYSTQRLKKEDDSGVAIYFQWKGKPRSLCCDQYQEVWENGYSIAQTISRMRDIARWGTSDFLEKAFDGFIAIPEDAGKDAFSILGLPKDATVEDVKAAFRKKAKEFHPDTIQGDNSLMVELNEAYHRALSSISV